MALRYLAVAVLAFALGLLTHRSLAPRVPATDFTSVDIARHWKRVNNYVDYLHNPANLQTSSGLTFVSVPYDIAPSLAILVSAGELKHLDIVLPNVPNTSEINNHWVQAPILDPQNGHVLQVIGNSVGDTFKFSGDVPLHLNIWYKPEAAAEIQQLVDELEALAEEIRQRPATNEEAGPQEDMTAVDVPEEAKD